MSVLASFPLSRINATPAQRKRRAKVQGDHALAGVAVLAHRAGASEFKHGGKTFHVKATTKALEVIAV